MINMDRYTVFVWIGDSWLDITEYISDLQSDDELNTLSVEVSFSLLQNPYDKYNRKLNISCGDRIEIKNNNLRIFAGIITNDSLDYNYTANDIGWYLNESELIFQANGVRADKAISLLCDKAGIPLGELPNLPYKITNLWLGETFSGILEDILKTVTLESGRQFLYRVQGGKLWLKDMPNEVLMLKHKPFDNVDYFNPTWALGSVSGGRSLSSLKNSIVLASEENDNAYILATAENSESIKRFGKLQKVISADDNMSGSTADIVKNALAENNVLSADYTVNMYGDDNAKSGRLVRFNSPAFGLKGIYRITRVTHYYTVPHTMELTVTPFEVDDSLVVSGEVYKGDSEQDKINAIIKDISQIKKDSESRGKGKDKGESLRDRFIKTAAAEIGTTEKPIGSNKTKYGEWFGMNGVAWCAIFLSWCSSHAGVSKDIVPSGFSSVSQFLQWFSGKGRYYKKGSYTPKIGDIMIQKSGGVSHIGIVESVNSSGFVAIEGNASNAVKRITYSFNNSKISGYGSPDWR